VTSGVVNVGTLLFQPAQRLCEQRIDWFSAGAKIWCRRRVVLKSFTYPLNDEAV
jgi:hypothetical protein